MPKTLSITPVPYKSSRLAIPPSPGSPRTPLVIAIPQPVRRAELRNPGRQQAIVPPRDPLRWTWQCHKCHRLYHLPTTNRCLDDGHRFCSGITTVKRNKKTGKLVKKHVACASEFDYDGWRNYGDWRREVIAYVGLIESNVAKAAKKDCWNTCDYPSQCRHGKLFGAETCVSPIVPSSSTPLGSDDGTRGEGMSGFTAISEPRSEVAAETTASHNADVKAPSLQDLQQSESRRKRKSTGSLPSPLGSHPADSNDDTGNNLLQEAVARFGIDLVNMINGRSAYRSRKA